MKFGRRCELSIEVNPDSTGNGQNHIVIPSDFTVEFSITRKSLASSQEATFRISNLGEQTRGLIYKDPYALTEFRAVQFRAGYDDFIPLAFNGFVRTAVSERQGTTWITEISAYDGGLAMANGFSSLTVASGMSVSQVLQNLAQSLPGTAGQAIIGAFPAVGKRGKVLFGNTWNLILEESGGLATIDNGQVKILNYNEAIKAEIPVINSQNGLLGSPRRSATSIDFEMLFEPRLTIGQIVQLESESNKKLNGTYKVMGFTHHGTISPAVSGDCLSSVSLFVGIGDLSVIQGTVVQ